MKNRLRNVKARFAPEVGFGVEAIPARVSQTGELERLKSRLLQELVANTSDPEESARLQCAADESAALVWLTPCPLLLFPVLLEEKARTATLQRKRQNRIRRRSRNLLALAA
jgi:hypothetical protein